jgi:tetratricopeptide (TPR) repeat protein
MNTLVRAMCAAALLAGLSAGRVARGDQLRNVEPGQEVPDISLPTIDKGTVNRADLKGKTVVVVFLSAQQHSSEQAAASARAVHQRLQDDDLALVFVTADTAQAPYFQELRARLDLDEPLALDFERKLYGELGLIVLPTTIVIDGQWRLAHVISSYKSDYEHVLEVYARHALGRIDDAELEEELAARSFQRDRPADRIARHRAASKLLRNAGLMNDAANELRLALEIDPDDADTRLDLASLELDTGRVEEASKIVADVLKADPTHRRARIMYGIVLYHAGRLDEAEAVLRDALVLDPDPVHTHYYLGLVYEKKGDTAKALEHYRQALSRLLKDRPL